MSTGSPSSIDYVLLTGSFFVREKQNKNMLRSLKVCLQLLMLLGKLIYNRSVMQHCPLESAFPNVTAVAGTPFCFDFLLQRTTLKHRRHLQISLANGKHLPSWMVYTHHSGRLVGLALAEDCGIHHLQISATNHSCTADFYVHVLSAPSIARDALPCPNRGISVWGNLLLQVDPVSLNASQRLHLVNLVSAYLQLPQESIALFSNTNILPHKTIRVCGPNKLKDKDFQTDATTVNYSQLVWPFGCKSQEQVFSLQDAFQNSFESGILAKQLDVPVSAWRFLCAIEAAQKVKRDVRDQLSTHYVASRETLPTLTSMTLAEQSYITSTGNTIGEMHSNLQSRGMTRVPNLSFDSSESDMSTLLLSFEQNISPLLITPSAYTASPAVMHVTTDLQRLPTSLTSGQDQEATAIWKTETFGYSHSESPSWAHMKSQVYSAFRLDFGSTSVSESVSEVSFNTDQSLQSLKATLLTQMFSPLNLYLSQPSITEPYGQSVPPTASVADLEEIFQQNATITDASLATQTAQNELESSMHSSFTLEPTESTNTSPLPSEFSANGQSWTYIPSFTVQGVFISQTFSTQPNEFMSQMASEIAILSSDDLQTSSTFQDIQTVTAVSEQIYSRGLFQSSFVNLFSESNHVSPYVSLQGSSTHAYFNTTPVSTATTSPSVTHPDQISTNETPVVTGSNHLEETTPSRAQNIIFSTTIYFSEMSYTLYPTVGMSPATGNKLESLRFSNREPTASIFRSPLTLEHGTSELFLTFEITSPTITAQDISVLHDSSHLSKLLLATQAMSGVADSSRVVCNGQNERGFCSRLFATSELNFQMISSTLDELESISATRMLEDGQTSFLIPSFTPFLSNIQTTMLPTAVDSQYEETSSVYFSNALLNSSDLFSASESYGTASYVEQMAPSTVHSPSTASTIHLFESLEPSFPLCNSLEFSLCASTVDSIMNGNTNTYWTSHFGEYWTSEVGSSGRSFSSFWQRGSERVESSAFSHKGSSVVLAPTSAQLIPSYLSATHQMPPDTWTPSYVTSLSVLTYTLSALGSSAPMGHCHTDSRSLLKCHSSAQATAGPPTQSTFSKLYSAVSSPLSAGHSSLDIVKPASPSATVSSTINFPPEASQTVPALTATVGFPFLYSLPQNTFVDAEDGPARALSLKMTLIDPPPPSVGSWLSLDGLELHGVPLEMDTHYAPQHVLLSARDKGGLSASLTFTIDLYRDPVEPCHVFTVAARLSLHSVLLHRHKMELFLSKISSYFNATSYYNLAIVSVAPGSTVVSWYNYSLCDKGECHYKDINSTWLAMTFENNKSKFKDAMQPEFPVLNVEPVAYREDCFRFTQTPPTTHKPTSERYTTPNVSTSTPIATTAIQGASYDKMADMFIALLVICSLILIVLFVAAVLYFCQKRPRVVAIFPSSRMLSVRSRDLSALRPRPALLLHPEIPPPPLRLWISLDQDDDARLSESHEQIDDDALQQNMKKFSDI